MKLILFKEKIINKYVITNMIDNTKFTATDFGLHDPFKKDGNGLSDFILTSPSDF